MLIMLMPIHKIFNKKNLLYFTGCTGKMKFRKTDDMTHVNLVLYPKNCKFANAIYAV